MEEIKQKYSTRDLIVVAAIAEFFSTFTLWMIESSIKYPLFVIETFSIITIFVILNNYDFKFTLKNIVIKKISLALLLDLILICFSSILIFLNIFNMGNSTIRLILAFVCISGLSGYALLNACKLTKYFSKLEIVVLSFLASFILSGFCTLIFLWADEATRSIIIPSVFILLGITSFVRHLKTRNIATKINSLSKNIDILPIMLSIVFYAISFYYIYPNFTLLHDTDISRYYSDSVILSRTPDLYSGFNYLLFDAFSSTLYILSGMPDVPSFLTIQIILSFILPISVYVLAKRFLVDVDRRIPAISILFYTIFSNFSFILFAKLKILNSHAAELTLLQLVGDKAYNGTIYFLQPFLWLAPNSVAFMMFICAFLLLKVQNITKSIFVPLYTTLILSMYLCHVADPIIFVGILGGYSLVSKSKSLRLDDALLSSFIAFVLASVLQVCFSIFWTSPFVPRINLTTMLPVILPMLLVSISMFWRRTMLYRLNLSMKFVSSKKFYYALSVILVSVYLFGFLTWFVVDDFKVSLVRDIYSVPWFIYPLSLGIVGLLALIAIQHFRYVLPNSSVALLFGSIVISVLIGRMISFVNSNLLYTGYFESRILWTTFLFLSLLAPLTLIKLMDQISVKRKFFGIIGISLIISIIVVSGFSSTVLILENWVQFNKSHTLTQKEYQATDNLKNILQHDPNAFTLGLSKSSSYAVTFAASPYQFPNPEVIVYSKRPEIPLFVLSAHDIPHAYIYTNSSDFDKEESQKGWFFQHLLPMLPIVFLNDYVTIYNETHVTYPRSNSDAHMLVPTSPSAASSLFYAYDIISLHDHNYTVMFDKDQNALTAKTVILSYDPPRNNNNKLTNSSLRETSDYISYVKSGGNLIVLNTNGYGSISDILFNLGNSSYETSKIVLPSSNSLPVNVTVVPITSTAKNVTISGFYTSPQSKSSIFIANKIIGLGKVTYVNIYPIISGFDDNRIDKTTLHAIFDKISDLINLDTINRDLQKDTVKGNFKEMIGNGNVAINSSSLIFPYDQFANMTIQNNDKKISIVNVTKLNISGYHYAMLYGNHASIAHGMGLYANASLSNSLEILFKNNAVLTVVSSNNRSSDFDNVSNILIQNNKSIQAYLWQPKVNIGGNTTFKQFSGKVGNTVYPLQNLNVTGNISWTLFMSDTYTYVSDISVSDPIHQLSHKSHYDEVGSVVPSFSHFKWASLPILVDCLLFIPFLIATLLLLFGNSKNVKQDKYLDEK
jgi:hypothetical protein